MTTAAEWAALAERCEAAKGQDCEIDATMYALARNHLNPSAFLESFRREIATKTMVPVYTASLDAITARIEREFPGWGYDFKRRKADESPYSRGCFASVWETPSVRITSDCGQLRPCASPALALCAAFCRAMAAKGEANG